MEVVDPRIDTRLVPPGSKARVMNGLNHEFKDLPAVRTPNGQTITRWTLTDEERAAVMRGDDIFVTLISFGPINPLFVTVGPVDWTADPL